MYVSLYVTKEKEQQVVENQMAIMFAPCRRCEIGVLVPLSDFGSQGSSILYKAWVCTNPDCGYNLKIRNGDVYIDEPILDATRGEGRHG